MLAYYQWRPLVNVMVEEMIAAKQEDMLFTPHGAPGAFALYQLPGMTLGPTFLNEFVGVSTISSTQLVHCGLCSSEVFLCCSRDLGCQ